ncbi:TraK family protein [Scandinavium goeteborgense]|uniref:TraK family protein n=1 Tax=Scandinavium goeteborgense TaxID=1851514 RepID=UPI00380F40D6
MKKKRNGKAQFTAVIEDITRLLKEGQSGVYIYGKLIEEKKIALSYPQFQRYLSEHKSPQQVQKIKLAEKSKDVQKTTSQTENKPVPQRDSFRRQTRVLHNPSMTDERRKELFGE